MTDKTGFSLDLSVNPASGLKPLPDWVAFDLCKAYPVPGGNLLLHNTRNGKRAMVKPEVYATLTACNQFQPLDQHVSNIIARNPGMQNQQANISDVLKRMLADGMMVSAKQVIDELKLETEPVAEKQEAGPPVVAILTWERPEALKRLLSSIVENCDTEKFNCLYVIDDSRKAENITQNQVLVEDFSARIKAPLCYFGQAAQRKFIADLIERLPEYENAIRFLIDQSIWKDHWTSGLSRNLALFLSCGQRLVMLDDDVVCDVYDPPGLRSGITVSENPREADFFENEKGWAALHQPINPDPVDRHMQCLGLTFSQALNTLGQNHLKPAGLENATSLQISELNSASPVLMTECGSLGCPGTDKNTWLPFIAPDSLKKMLRSAKKTTLSLTARKVWSGRNQPHFAPRPNMSAITGLDNRQMLPPYLPFLRGEDRLFGNMLDFIHPSGITLDYPWAVPHLPIPDRKWSDKDLVFTPEASFPVFFIDRLVENKATCHSSTPNSRLAALSAWFNDLACASPGQLADMHQDSRLRGDSEVLQQLDKLLAEAESAPVNWQNYLRNGIQQMNMALDHASQEDFPIRGLPSSLEGNELISFWTGVWRDFAKVLDAWPEIRKAAADIVEA